MEGWETWRAGLYGETGSPCLLLALRALGMEDTVEGEWAVVGIGLWRGLCVGTA